MSWNIGGPFGSTSQPSASAVFGTSTTNTLSGSSSSPPEIDLLLFDGGSQPPPQDENLSAYQQQPGRQPARDPCDSITSIAFTKSNLVPQNDMNIHLLAVASWDGTVRIFQIETRPKQSVGVSDTKIAMDNNFGPKFQAFARLDHGGAAIMDVAWSKSNPFFLAVSDINGKLYVYDCSKQPPAKGIDIKLHDDTIKSCRWVDIASVGEVIATGSWDKFVKFFNPYTQQLVAAINLDPGPDPPQQRTEPEKNRRVYAMDFAERYLLVATANRGVWAYDLGDISQVTAKRRSRYRCSHVRMSVPTFYPLSDKQGKDGPGGVRIMGTPPGNVQTQMDWQQSTLKWQTRSIACTPTITPPNNRSQKDLNDSAFCLGTIEGRVAVMFVNPNKQKTAGYSFRCHRRDTTNVPTGGKTGAWAVNSVAFNSHNTVATAGSDGSIAFWDLAAKSKLKAFDHIRKPKNPLTIWPITSAAFTFDSSIYAYAQSYDWSEGEGGNTADKPTKVWLHACTIAELSKTK